jgi:hypothetical protein
MNTRSSHYTLTRIIVEMTTACGALLAVPVEFNPRRCIDVEPVAHEVEVLAGNFDIDDADLLYDALGAGNDDIDKAVTDWYLGRI